MRLSLFAFAAFAALATARSSFPRHRARDVSLQGLSPIRINGTEGDIELLPQSVNNGIGWYTKGHAPETGSEQKDAANPPINPFGIEEPLNSFKVKLSMGNKKQHIGGLLGPEAWRAIHKVLMEICPEGKPECEFGEKHQRIIRVDYQSKQGDIRQGNFIVKVVASSYNGPGNHMIRNLRRQLMIAAIAGAIEQQTLDTKNCFETKQGWHCNVGSPISVNIEDQDYITVEFHSRPLHGHFDCVAVIQASKGAIEHDFQEWRRAYHGAYLDGIEVVCDDIKVT